jgi:hypothetical protein
MSPMGSTSVYRFSGLAQQWGGDGVSGRNRWPLVGFTLKAGNGHVGQPRMDGLAVPARRHTVLDQDLALFVSEPRPAKRGQGNSRESALIVSCDNAPVRRLEKPAK